MRSKENLTAIKTRREPVWVERVKIGTLTPPRLVTVRALGNILIGSWSTGVSAVAGSGVSRDCLPNEVRVIKNPSLTGVVRWNDVDKINRRPRKVSVRDQDGTHGHPQIVLDHLFWK